MSNKAELLAFVQSVDWDHHLNDPTVVSGVESIRAHIQKPSEGVVGTADTDSTNKRVKLVVVGDGAVGKTSLLIRYATGDFPTDYLPTVFENYTAHMKRDKETIMLHLWDTAGQEDYDRLRPLSYPGADVVLLCFSTINQASYDSIREKWAPEVQHYIPGIPYILIGTKIDLREAQTPDANTGKYEPLNQEHGKKMCEEIGAVRYMEICSKTAQGVQEVFDTAVNLVLKEQGSINSPTLASSGSNAGKDKPKKKKQCIVM
eukprot:TRINITY_DN889_c0_g1_i1.p1 TRINITY_DN889_c0_g1~~TRINITY_DN889_c0_g1_i1.p1  ORF type:complete len:260 (-),score=69.51 TRINITY_DN889_c0_g1_i1:86-865(-)